VGILEGAVDRRGRCPQVPGQGAEAQVGDLVAHETAGEPQRVDAAVRQPRVAALDQGGVEEGDVEAHVVADEDRRADELEERRQHLGDRWRRQHHRLGDAGEHRDQRRDGDARVHERLERPEALAAPQLHCPDLGDLARPG
jgi:hypothetical protein